MPEILTLQGDYWSLGVWTRDIESPRRTLRRTLEKRGKTLPETVVRFSPESVVLRCEFQEGNKPGSIHLPDPLFFENRLYEFDFRFADSVDSSPEPRVLHRLVSICDAFHLSGRSFRGSVNFGNNIGWFRLGLRFFVAKRPMEHFLAFEVFPTKMDMKEDLDRITQMVDKTYPLWRFSFVQKTEQELAASKKPHERFPLLWLALFRSLREELVTAVTVLSRSPHSRLVSRDRLLQLEKIKGSVSPRLEERIAEEITGGGKQRRYRIETRKNTVDTPENRFVKMVLTKSVRNLQAFIKGLSSDDVLSAGDRLSPYFLEEMKKWSSGLERCLSDPLFRSIGDYQGIRQESLVLQKKPGYSKVYRIWQELKLYLDFFGRSASISMKSVAELYEIWCLLEIRNILSDLGFQEDSFFQPSLRKSFFEKELPEGGGAAFSFVRPDGLAIRLSHEPVFSRPKNGAFNSIFSWTTVQKPDIFLEAQFPDGKKIRWIFDAKYRISSEEEGFDLIPDDAINQMHRYRDALVYLSKSGDGEGDKSRPVLGAFVLYPGWIDEEKVTNPYKKSIEEVGIGGFPLLPGRENLWLRSFLGEMFGQVVQSETLRRVPESDEHLLKDSVRIAPTGLSLSRYRDLTLVASLSGRTGREKEYFERFLQGKAGWYHIPVSTTENYKVARTAIREIRYCAIAVSSTGVPDRRIEFLYDVLSIRLVRRNELTLEQAGKIDLSNSALYWLFELGSSRTLKPLVVPGKRCFRFMLTGARDLMESREWKDLPDRYAFLREERLPVSGEGSE